MNTDNTGGKQKSRQSESTPAQWHCSCHNSDKNCCGIEPGNWSPGLWYDSWSCFERICQINGNWVCSGTVTGQHPPSVEMRKRGSTGGWIIWKLQLSAFFLLFGGRKWNHSRFQRPRGLRRRSASVRLLELWGRFPPGAWMFVPSVVRDALITRPEESYRLWCVVVCDLETSRLRWSWPAVGRRATKKK